MYQASENRYDSMIYRKCGKNGLALSVLSLGYWHNFSQNDPYENARALTLKAFDSGINHFDLANRYGPPWGYAEEVFGKIFRNELSPYRDEITVATKAGNPVLPGPLGRGGTRKHLLSQLDGSLKRLGMDYVDIFYHHSPDLEVPIEESMGALVSAVHSGKALYAAISAYAPDRAKACIDYLRSEKVPLLLHQPRYNMLDRSAEATGLLALLENEGVGCIAFSPLAQGLLSGKYNNGIPADSRIVRGSAFFNESHIEPELIEKVKALVPIANARGQSISQMALAWVLKHTAVTSVIIGVSKTSQIEENVKALGNISFSDEENAKIDSILG